MFWGAEIIMVSIEEILMGMENDPRVLKSEEAFEFTKSLIVLEEFCPIHECGEKDFLLLRYRCSVCGRILDKKEKFC